MNTDETPLRTVEVGADVPGTPEQVWDAIATGAGIAAWFVPAEVEPREGGEIAYDFGGGMQGAGRVTAWEPPRRFAGEEEWPASDTRPAARLATEFLVESRAGGTCVVRVVSSVFASGGDWERELGSMEEGWQLYLGNLRRYLAGFAGRPTASISVMADTASGRDDAWADVAVALGAADAAAGSRVSTAGTEAPPLAGRVEQVVDSEHHRGLVLRLDEPAPGFALVLLFSWEGAWHVNVHAYLFGDEAAAVAERDAPAWRAWAAERFAAPAGSATGA
jgi:uncharacterized protein YndB with AHSA1/START domain